MTPIRLAYNHQHHRKVLFMLVRYHCHIIDCFEVLRSRGVRMSVCVYEGDARRLFDKYVNGQLGFFLFNFHYFSISLSLAITLVYFFLLDFFSLCLFVSVSLWFCLCVFASLSVSLYIVLNINCYWNSFIVSVYINIIKWPIFVTSSWCRKKQAFDIKIFWPLIGSL